MSSSRVCGRPFPRALALALAAAVCFAERSASADPSPSDVVTAKNAMRDGRTARDAGRWEDAAKAFRAAFALVPTPNTGSQLAQALVASGHLVEAREVAFAVVKMPVVPNEPPEHADGRGAAMVLARELDARIPTLTIDVGGLQPGVDPEVTLDGVTIKVATLGVARAVDPGKHVVVVRAAGHREQRKEFTAAEQQKVKETVTMALEGPTPSVDLKVGTQVPRVEAPKDAQGAAQSAVSAGAPPSSGWRTVGVATASVGGATLLAGGVFGALAVTKWNDAKATCGPACPADSIAHTQAAVAATYGNAATISLIAGGALAAAGVSMVLLSPSRAERTVAVELAPGFAAVSGRF